MPQASLKIQPSESHRHITAEYLSNQPNLKETAKKLGEAICNYLLWKAQEFNIEDKNSFSTPAGTIRSAIRDRLQRKEKAILEKLTPQAFREVLEYVVQEVLSEPPYNFTCHFEQKPGSRSKDLNSVWYFTMTWPEKKKG